MSNYHSAYQAGKSGKDWYYVQTEYGDSYDVRRAYDEGRAVYRYSTGPAEAGMAESFGSLIGLVAIAMATFYIFVVLYSPLLLIAFVLLCPFFPYDILKHVEDQWLTYGGLMLAVTYALSCGFEFLRARMLEARFRNHRWKGLFLFIFSFRIILPGILIYLGLLISSRNAYFTDLFFRYEFVFPALFVVLMLLWKVKILDPQSRFYFTGWAFERGIRSMANVPVLESSQSELARTSEERDAQVRRFYLIWLATTTIIGIVLFRIIATCYPDVLWPHEMPMSVILLLSFTSAAVIAKKTMDKAHAVFEAREPSEKVKIKDWKLLMIGLIATLPMWFDFVKDLSPYGIMLVFAVVAGIQVWLRLRKEKRVTDAL